MKRRARGGGSFWWMWVGFGRESKPDGRAWARYGRSVTPGNRWLGVRNCKKRPILSRCFPLFPIGAWSQAARVDGGQITHASIFAGRRGIGAGAFGVGVGGEAGEI